MSDRDLERMVAESSMDELFPPGQVQDPARLERIVHHAAVHMKRSIIYRAYLERPPGFAREEKCYSEAYAAFLADTMNQYVGGKRNGEKKVPKFQEDRISFAPESAFVVAFQAGDILTVKLLCALGVPTSGDLFGRLKDDPRLSGYATKLGDHMYKNLCKANLEAAAKFAKTDGPAARSGKAR